jgi:hypothetical protein
MRTKGGAGPLDRLPASGRRLYEVPGAALQGYYLAPEPCSGIAQRVLIKAILGAL